MTPSKPLPSASSSTSRRRPSLQRHGGERHTRQALAAAEHRLVRKARPIGAFLGRQFVAEHVEPAARHLAVDPLRREPGFALRHVGHAADTGRVGAPPAKPSRVAALLDCRAWGNAASARNASSNSAGTTWACVSTIIFLSLILRRQREVAQCRRRHRQFRDMESPAARARR